MVEVIREELPNSDLSETRNSFRLPRAQGVPFKFKLFIGFPLPVDSRGSFFLTSPGRGRSIFIPLRTQNVVFALVAPHPHVCVFVLKSARSRRVGHLESLRNIFSRLRCLYIKIRPRICEGSNASKLCTADENIVEATIFQVKTTYLCLNGHTYLPFADR